jgi:hypothetical protein
MTWSYGPNFSQDKDKIRAEIGDVTSTDPILSDEEIAGAISLTDDLPRAMLKAAKWAVARLALQQDTNFKNIKSTRSQRHDMMVQTVARLEADIAASKMVFGVPSKINRVKDVDAMPAEFNATDATAQPWQTLED